MPSMNQGIAPRALGCWLLAIGLALLSINVMAASKILATPGATQIEGSAGGGIVPWAVIGGYGSEGEWGAAASISAVHVDDFQLSSAAVHAGFNNRVEMSFAQQSLQMGRRAEADLGAALGANAVDTVIAQQVFGVKIRLLGDLIYGALPQLSAGLQYKINQNSFIPVEVLGAHSDTGTDYYFAASKLLLHSLFERNLLLNATARYTDANQTGLLGFGNAGGASPKWVGEASAALFMNAHWAVGAEYRDQPNQLASVDEGAWVDAFVGWFPSRRISVVGAYTDLGTIALWERQRGWYLSIQISN